MQVQNFFRQYPDAGAGERGRKQALETIRTNIMWMNKNANQISDWLRLNNQ
jgi:glutamyl aminopeptidase